ncbi:exonuclease subunit SbcD [Candidatus Dependentiae bacterium]|nr:MAG: exonuclease subunit SbcD [Candidatus Dependentiae bacterium]
MIRFIHTADFHFGIENYGKVDPSTGIHSRLLDFDKALQFCVTRALKEQVDFFIFCGDAYKTINPNPTQQKLLVKSFLQLYRANIPVVIIVGNHDNPLSFGKAHSLDIFKELPLDGFYVIAKPETILLDTMHGPVQIVGIPWPTRTTIAIKSNYLSKSSVQLSDYISNAVATVIQKKANELDPNIPAILAAHITVSNGIFSGSEKRAIYGSDPCLLPSQLAIAPFDYVALGHLHRHQIINPNGYPAIVYAGSIERIDFGERNEEKGFYLVSIAEKNKTSYEFVPIPARSFIQIEVQLQSERDQTQQILEAIKQHAIDNAVVKIRYHIPPDKKDLVDLKKIQAACNSTHYLAGIIPIHKPAQHNQRLSMKVDVNLATLLNAYFDSKPELKKHKQRLIEKTLALQKELEQQEES